MRRVAALRQVRIQSGGSPGLGVVSRGGLYTLDDGCAIGRVGSGLMVSGQ
jgi:hypothetical protein